MQQDESRQRGRPRRHASNQARVTAYLRRATGQGLVRVSVLVPASRADDIKAIAAAMRTAAKSRHEAANVSKADPAFPNAGRTWSPSDQDALMQTWQSGGTADELTSGLGRPLEEIMRRLVMLEEVGSIKEAQAEFDARARAERRYWSTRNFPHKS